jgi:diguanylate cyclase (GGDEF)-like protein
MPERKESNFWSILAQPQSIFWIIRGSFFLSIIFWVLFAPEYDHRIWALVAFFLTYSFGILIFAKNYRIPEENLYFFTTFLDLIFITLAGLLSDRRESEFFYLFFLAVPFGSYAAGLFAGLLLAMFSSILYLSVNVKDLSALPTSHVLFQILTVWILAITVGLVVNELKNSRAKLLRMFDVLNQRTSELERSQAQIASIYETSRCLVEKLNLNEVVEEILKIVQRMLEYRSFSLFILNPSGLISLLGEIKEGEKIIHTKPKEELRKGFLSVAMSRGKPVRIIDLSQEKQHESENNEMKSLMAVPMISRGKVIGVMETRSLRVGAFLEQDEKIFSILAGSAALAIENALLHEKTEDLTIVDELTGLYNYRYFTRKLKTELRRAERYEQPLSLLMIDIDWFKRYNDTYGHLFGNLVLQDLAGRIKESVREVDEVCRYGGEEFVVILPQTKKEDAQMIGERIRQRVGGKEFIDDQENARVRITVSIGVATYPENGKTPKELTEKMDQALYLAKGEGKNLVRVL